MINSTNTIDNIEISKSTQSPNDPSLAKKERRKRVKKKKRKRHTQHNSKIKPVMTSNVQKYTTESLRPPSYSTNSNHIPSYHNQLPPPPSRAGHGQFGHNPQHIPRPEVGSKRQYNEYMNYHQNVQQQRLAMQQHIASSTDVLVNPYRQFSIAFNQ